MASWKARRAGGFIMMPVHRANLSGRLVARTGNPLLKPCPRCGARRYERCYRWTGVSSVTFTEEERKHSYSEDGRFLDVLPNVHRDRLDRVMSETEEDDNEGAK